MNKKKKGFTLVELLVVIAILAILATVCIIGYTSFTKKAKESVYEQEKTQQQIADLAAKVDNLTLLTWDDVEDAVKQALDNRGDTDVKTAINNLARVLKNRTGNTLLTKEQVTKIIEKSLNDRNIPTIVDLKEIVEEMFTPPIKV